jgi:Mrp family chromosome partitioning ATPase
MSLVLSMALGLGIGLVAGFLVEALDEGLTSTDDLERKVGLSALASIPKLTPKELRPFADSPTPVGVYLLEKQMSVFAEAFRVLRASILFAAHQAKTQVVAITSATPNEGKTTTALCFGRVAALSGQRVMIIDCDLRRRTLKKLLNIEPAAGLIQVLSGKATWQEAAYLDEASGAQVLSLTGWTFDCAPVLAVAETRVVAAQADCTLVIARWRKTPVRAIRAAIQQLQAGGAILRGVVINGVDRRAPYYYSYPEYHASEV